MAEMLTDLLQNIYSRIAQLGKTIQALKTSLDDLNANIEDKIMLVSTRMDEFGKEIETTQTRHVESIKEIGADTTKELENLKSGLGIDSIQTLIDNLENFSGLASEVLNQDTVNLLLSEAISSVKELKGSLGEEEEE